MSSFIAALALSVLNIAASILLPVDVAGPYCGEAVNTSFMSNSVLLKSDPGNFLGLMGIIEFKTSDSYVCVSQRRPQNSFTTLTVVQPYEEEPVCCNFEERAQYADKQADGVRDDTVFDTFSTSTHSGFSYYEVIPDSCPQGAGCPLVVEISGAGGHPWAMVLSKCTACKAEMKVVMIAPILGDDEDTSTPYVKNIVQWASAYLEKASNIDHERVYLASVSRGNEIGIQAAIFGAHIFKAVVMTGKFKVPKTFQSMWMHMRAEMFTGKPKLTRVVLHLGDEDDVLTDKEFYPKLADMMTVMAKAVRPPTIELSIYRGAGHDITWTTWNEMHSVLWTGSD